MDALAVFVLVGVLATVIALFNGIASMAAGGDADFRHSHELMFRRVGLQAATVAVVIFALLMSR